MLSRVPASWMELFYVRPFHARAGLSTSVGFTPQLDSCLANDSLVTSLPKLKAKFRNEYLTKCTRVPNLESEGKPKCASDADFILDPNVEATKAVVLPSR